METKIELQFGFKDGQGKVHTDVELGKRPKMKNIFALDTDPRANVPTQYTDLVRRLVITKFGSLQMPVDISVLLALNTIDREDLADAVDRYLIESSPEVAASNDSDGLDIVTMGLGFELDGTSYTKVAFGNLLTGKDEVDADKLGLRGVGREAFLLGRQVTKLWSSDGIEINGPIGIDRFNDLDADDYTALRTGARLWRLSFRIRRESLLRERNGDESIRADEGNESDRGSDLGHVE